MPVRGLGENTVEFLHLGIGFRELALNEIDGSFRDFLPLFGIGSKARLLVFGGAGFRVNTPSPEGEGFGVAAGSRAFAAEATAPFPAFL